jgi:hypothetical protein
MALQQQSTNLKDLPSKSENTLATNCVHCNIKFKERDKMTIVDGQVVHNTCAEMYKNGKSIAIYKDEFPYLSETEIDRIFYTEGEEGFQTIRDNAWVVLTNLGTQEMIVSGFPDETGVTQHIEYHYEEEGDEQASSIESIYNNGTKYNYSISITASVSPAS